MTGPYIPAGRTSIVKRGEEVLQLQTEYAPRPRPRVTTAVSSQGRVLHKIERELEAEVDTIEAMHRVEEMIKAQHLEVSKLIRGSRAAEPSGELLQPVAGRVRSEEVRKLPEVEKVFLITADGRLMGEKETTAQFRKIFKHVLRELPEMLKVFSALPGGGQRREYGIYEVEPGRIILASTGIEFYLILIRPGTPFAEIEKKLNRILFQ